MSSRRLGVRCPAKVNLSLRVLGRRADGYHELDTVFQAIELWDEISAQESDELSLSCDDPALATDDTNLVVRAARKLQAVLPSGARVRGARLHLRKRIPAGAGLGGGSSDAAGTLLLLAQLWQARLTLPVLADLAGELGSDVPFFLHGGTAHGTGRGERVAALPFVGELPLLLGVPPFALSTAEVYREHAKWLTLPGKDVTVRRFSYRLKWQRDKDLSLPVCNDLEGVVFASRPELAEFKNALLETGARFALLSGSGSTVFGAFEDAAEVDSARRTLAKRFDRWSFLPTRASSAGPQVFRPSEDPDAARIAGG